MNHADDAEFNPADFLTDTAPATPATAAAADQTPAPATRPQPAPAAAPEAAPAAVTPGSSAAAAAEASTGTTSPAADTAATEPAPAPAAEPAPETGDQQATAEAPGTAIYTYRKIRALAVVTAIVAGLWWVNTHGWPHAAPSLAEQQAAQAMSGDLTRDAVPATGPQAQAADDQAAARRYRRTHGTYRGFTAAGARIAANDSALVASRIDETGTCWIYAVTGNHPTNVEVDQSGLACTAAEMAATQAQLDTAARQQAQALSAAAEAGFAHAANTAAQYALGSWRGGQQTLTGLTGEIGDHVTVLANHGAWLEATYNDGSICRVATISIDGTVGDSRGC